jgi:hypothetical protein
MQTNQTAGIKNDNTKLIDAHLNCWARRTKENEDIKFKFTSETMENIFMRDEIIPDSYLESCADDDIAIEVDKAIQIMPMHLRKVIKIYYLCSGSVQQKAKELKMTRVTFHEYLRIAKYWLLGYWSKITFHAW